MTSLDFHVCLSISDTATQQKVIAVLQDHFVIENDPQEAHVFLTDNPSEIYTGRINVLVAEASKLANYQDSKGLLHYDHYVVYSDLDFLISRLLKTLARHRSIKQAALEESLLMYTGAHAVIGHCQEEQQESTYPLITKSFQITRSSDRHFFADELERFLQSEDITKCLKYPVNPQYPVEIQEELLMNAIWDANPKYMDQERTIPIELTPEEAVTLEWAFNGKELAISVKDPFGRLNPNMMGKYIDFMFKKNPMATANSLENKSVRAGLGLYMVVQKANLLSVFVKSGKLTDVGVVLLLSERRTKVQHSKAIDIIKV